MYIVRKTLFLAVLILFATTAFAKKNKKKRSDSTSVKMMTDSVVTAVKDTTKKEVKSNFKKIKEVTEKCKRTDGLFPLYQDTITGKLYMEINQDKIGKEFIYFAYVLDGYLDAGYARGGYKDNSIFKIEKYYDRIDFVIQNTNFFFDPNNALSKAKDANINKSLFLSEKIAAATGNIYLIEADNLFLGENITQIKPSKRVGEKPDAFSLGTLNSKKTKYLSVKNFPKNTDVAVEYVFDNPYPMNYGEEDATDARFVSAKVAHSIIEVPQNNYQPRFDDPRVGYFMEKVDDQTSTSSKPYRDLIHRWNLEKKNPNDALSEPVKPIVWWIEKTTPVEFRPIVKNAVLAWNEAFEKAGFKNAVECYEQPDTASWEADDIRYNVIRWTSSPRPPFGGYGPSMVNPRTGEILSADIMLEFIYLTNRLVLEKLYDIAALDNYQPTIDHFSNDHCSFGDAMHNNILLGMQMLSVNEISDINKDEFLKQALYDLVLHEVGHTMGLMHNFIGSQLHSNDEMQDPVLGATVGLTASVMDYTIPNISPDKNKQGLYFDVKPGLYDKWAIEYGYRQFENAEAEKAGLKNILDQSYKKEYRFKNDADDMRSVGRGIDPRGNLYDMSSDAVGYAINGLKMVNDVFPKLLEKYSIPNESYHELRNAYLILTGHYNRNLTVISRYIGGIYVNREFVGQPTNSLPLSPIPYEEQKRAMQAIIEYAFSKNAFNFQEKVYNYLQMQRRGYEFRKETEDPKIHDRYLNIQKGILAQLLNESVLQRLVDTKMYGNKYSINNMLKDMTNGIFMEDLGAAVSTIRQNLQQEYVKKLLAIIDEKSTYSNVVKGAAYGEVERILAWMDTAYPSDNASKSHRSYIAFMIKNALANK